MRWGCIQPLTGGMYIGALQATGCNAQWIIDFPGHQDIKTKDGVVTDAANEVMLLEWLKKNNKSVPVYTLNRKMFQQDMNLDVTYKDNVAPDFTDMDLVVAVPVCSGLSNVTIASEDTKNERNCNMEWITSYTLGVIKPKVYIFENAPTLASDKGKSVRDVLNKIANENGYSVSYVKTDTVLHNNAQKRPRTFVMFVKNRNGETVSPLIDFENINITADNYFKLIPETAEQQEPIKIDALNDLLIRFCKHKYGENWRQSIKCVYVIKQMTANAEIVNEILKFVENDTILTVSEKTKITAFFEHALQKVLEGKNFYSTTLTLYTDYTPSIQFKSLQCVLHHAEDRLFSTREALWLMGMPHDFNLIGNVLTNIAKVGQNVPVGTAKYITTQAVNTINNYDNLVVTDKIQLFDNIKQKITFYE